MTGDQPCRDRTAGHKSSADSRTNTRSPPDSRALLCFRLLYLVFCKRLGAQAIERVFRKLTGPLAPAGLEGSFYRGLRLAAAGGFFYRGLRLAAAGGFVLDAPETEANRRRLGGPKDARGQVAGFPPVRVVTLTETGTHAQTGAAVDGACCGEPELAIRLAPRPQECS